MKKTGVTTRFLCEMERLPSKMIKKEREEGKKRGRAEERERGREGREGEGREGKKEGRKVGR